MRMAGEKASHHGSHGGGGPNQACRELPNSCGECKGERHGPKVWGRPCSGAQVVYAAKVGSPANVKRPVTHRRSLRAVWPKRRGVKAMVGPPAIGAAACSRGSGGA